MEWLIITMLLTGIMYKLILVIYVTKPRKKALTITELEPRKQLNYHEAIQIENRVKKTHRTTDGISRIAKNTAPFFLIALSLLPLQTAKAQTTGPNAAQDSYYLPTCTNYFAQWDLPKAIKEKYGSYEHGTTPLFIFKSNSTDANRNIFTGIIGVSSQQRFDITHENPTTTENIALYPNGQFAQFTVTDEPKGPQFGFDQYYNSGNARLYITPNTNHNVIKTYLLDNNSASCWAAYQGNVRFLAPYTDLYEKANNIVEYFTSEARPTCAGFPIPDIPCFVAYYAKPSPTAMQTEFNSLESFFNAKLGFLVYPFSFFAGVFNAFTSSSSWCNTTTCTKSFGNIFGTPYTVNLTQLSTTMPQLWSFLLIFMRGALIVGLLYGIRAKYLEVMSK